MMAEERHGKPFGLRHYGGSLRRNFSWTLCGNVVYAGCQWGMLIVLAKAGTPEIVGRFALALAITAPIMLFANLHLRNVQATDATQRYKFHDYFILRLITTAAGLMVIGLVVYVGGYQPETGKVILLVGAAKAVESISDIIYGLFQQQELMHLVAQSMIVKGAASLAALSAVMVLTHSLVYATLAMAVAWLLVLLIVDFRQARAVLADRGQVEQVKGPEDQYSGLNAATLVQLLRLAFPLGIVALLVSLTPNIPRYFIEHSLGEHSLGIFSALAYILVAGRTIIMALAQSAGPRLARSYASNNMQAFHRLLLTLTAIGGIIGVVGVVIAILLGEQILTIMYSLEYAHHVDVFVVLMIAAAVGYIGSLLWQGILAARIIGVQVPLFLTVTTVVTLGSSLLIPRFQLMGAALAVLAGMMAQLILSTALIWRSSRRAHASTITE